MLHLPFLFLMIISVMKIAAVAALEVIVGDSPVAVGRVAFADNGVFVGAHIVGLSEPGAYDGALLRVHLNLDWPFALDKHTVATRETHLGLWYENTWLSETMTCPGLE